MEYKIAEHIDGKYRVYAFDVEGEIHYFFTGTFADCAAWIDYQNK